MLVKNFHSLKHPYFSFTVWSKKTEIFYDKELIAVLKFPLKHIDRTRQRVVAEGVIESIAEAFKETADPSILIESDLLDSDEPEYLGEE